MKQTVLFYAVILTMSNRFPEQANISIFIKIPLQYKLDRIHKICGLNPRSFRDGVILYLALRLKEM